MYFLWNAAADGPSDKNSLMRILRENRENLSIQEPPLHIVAPHDGLFEYANTNIIIQNLASFYARSRQKLGENNRRGIKIFFSR